MAIVQVASDGAGTMPAPSFDFTDDFASQFRALVACRAGVIEVERGRPQAALARAWARRPSQLEALLWGARRHRQLAGDRCWLYFHQPRRFPNFLVVSYVFSHKATSLATIRLSLALLDLLAQRRRTDALLCDVATTRISERALARWGWEPLAPSRWHRRHIKRFYGHYDLDPRLLALCAVAPAAPAVQLTLSR